VEYELPKAASISQTAVYWHAGRATLRPPESWRVLYRAQDGEWKAVENAEPYGAATDRYNWVSFKPITTERLRLELKLQPGKAAGVSEWAIK
jgi:hypothetical protein